MKVEFNQLHPLVIDLKSRMQHIYEKDYTLPRSLHVMLSEMYDAVRDLEKYIYECRSWELREMIQGDSSRQLTSGTD